MYSTIWLNTRAPAQREKTWPQGEQSSAEEMKILGLISDTHGLLRDAALCALHGSDLILHAGDVGAPEILKTLKTIAPVVAVRGNVDTAEWAQVLPFTEVIQAGPVMIYILHILQDLDIDPAAKGCDIVVSGHSHKPGQTEKDGVLYINPGSAGPRRFYLPVTLARLNLETRPWKVEFIDLESQRSTGKR
ncbi:MAG TPA: metallophosphoesterase family protein [Candidatus Acidoferrum sp.]|nr:metallophosphoesterase family protein [Candidatus Acidoferrum sp.]